MRRQPCFFSSLSTAPRFAIKAVNFSGLKHSFALPSPFFLTTFLAALLSYTMAISKLVNLLAVTTLAILALSTSPEPVSALSLDNHVRHVPRHHGSILRNKKRAPADSRRCRPRSGPGNTDSSPEPATSSTDSGPLSTFAPPADPISTPGPAASVDPGSNNGGNNDQQNDGNQQVTPPQEQPTPTPQAPPPFVPAPPPPSGGRGKAGLAWGIDDPFALSNMVSAKVSRYVAFSLSNVSLWLTLFSGFIHGLPILHGMQNL